MSKILGHFDFAEEIERFNPESTSSGRRATTLIKGDRLRVVLVTMNQGATLNEHTAPGPITIQTLRGRFTVSVEADEHALPEGSMISIAAQVPHAVRAEAPGAFLLTIGWPPEDSGDHPAEISG
jgi:quercetin dioxygenase-like cupin family protein